MDGGAGAAGDPAPAAGWLRRHGEDGWVEARFALDHDGPPALLVHGRDEPAATAVILHDITNVDEISPSLPGTHRVEVEIDREPRFEAVWPPEFTPQLVAELRTTLTPTAMAASTPASAVPERRNGRAFTALVVALALSGAAAMVAGFLSLDTSDGTTDRPPATSGSGSSADDPGTTGPAAETTAAPVEDASTTAVTAPQPG